jgi:hypothetical protein
MDEGRARTGAPTSLARHDMGLATMVGKENRDACATLKGISPINRRFSYWRYNITIICFTCCYSLVMLKTTAAVYSLTSFIFLLLVTPISSIAATITSNNDHTEPFWTNGSPIPTQRTEVSATAVGDSVYVIGGFNAQGQPTNIVEVYNTKNNRWSSAAALPHPLHHTAAATSLDGKIYVATDYLYMIHSKINGAKVNR